MLAGTSQSERARSDVQLRSELNPVLDEALREIVAHSPGLAESPCRSLCVEIHTKLNRFCGTYDPRLLELVSEHVEVAFFPVGGDPIYKFDAEDCAGENKKLMWQSAFEDVPVPPLVWLLSGAAEHHWTGGSVAVSHDIAGIWFAFFQECQQYRVADRDSRTCATSRMRSAMARWSESSELTCHKGWPSASDPSRRMYVARRSPVWLLTADYGLVRRRASSARCVTSAALRPRRVSALTSGMVRGAERRAQF